MSVIWSLYAQDQLRQSADYIENRFGQKSRMKFLDDIYRIAPQIISFPYLGIRIMELFLIFALK